MKTSVRFISLLLAIFMLAGMAITVSADNTLLVAAAPDTVGDDAMAFLKAIDVMVGDEKGNMNPEGFLKRSEVAKLVYVLKTSFTEAEETNTEFIDVDDGHWASGYINALNLMGVIGGYGDGTFGPDDYVTGDQLAKMLLGVLGVSEFDSKLWPADVRASAKKFDMFEKLSKLTLSENIKRRHAAQMIYNIFDEVIEDSVTEKKYTLTSFFGVETVDALVSGVHYVTVDEESSSTNEKPVVIKLLQDSVQLNAAANERINLASGVICGVTNANIEEYIGRIVAVYVKDGEIIGHAIRPNKTVEGFKLNKEETALDYEDDELIINNNTVWLNPQLNAMGTGSGHYALAEKLGFLSEPSYENLLKIAKHAHKALLIDNNNDGYVDYILWDIIARYQLTNVSSSGFTFANNPHNVAGYNANTYRAINKYQVSGYDTITNETEEFLAHAFYGRLTRIDADVKEGVVTSWSNEKITIDGATYELNKDVFREGDAYTGSDVGLNTADCVGEKYKVCAYDGVIYTAERVYNEDDLIKFALLLYVEEPETPEYDMTTHTFSKAFSAVVSIGGRDRRIPISQETYDKFVTSRVETPTDDPATEPFIKKIDENGYLVTYPTLVTYTVDEDGVYTLTDNIAADGTIPATISTGKGDEVYNLYLGATIKRDDLLWTAYNSSNVEISGTLPANKVDTIIDTNSQIFYQYTKDETGGEEGHKHYGMLTVAEAKKLSKSTSDKNAFEGVLYGQFNEAGDFFYVIAAYIEEVKYHESTSSSSTKDFRTDGRQIVYARKQPVQALSEDGESVAYAHAFKNITTNTNNADAVVNVVNDPADTVGGVASVKYGFYGYDEAEDTYYKLDATTIAALGATSINVYTFDKIFNNCLFATGGNGDLVDGASLANAKLYKVRASYADTFTAITVDAIKEEAKEGTLGELIVITYKDSKGNTQISAVIANYDNKTALNEFKTPSAN